MLGDTLVDGVDDKLVLGVAVSEIVGVEEEEDEADVELDSLGDGVLLIEIVAETEAEGFSETLGLTETEELKDADGVTETELDDDTLMLLVGDTLVLGVGLGSGSAIFTCAHWGPVKVSGLW